MADSLNLGRDWDKTFPLSPAVEHSKAVFRNRFGIELAADVYVPKGASGRLPAIAVCGPFGAVKEQASGLYARAMAERGFLTLAFDLRPLRERAGESPVTWHLRISTPRTFGSCGGLSEREGGRGAGANRHNRHLRLGRPGPERRGCGYADKGHGGLDDVRHEPRHRPGLLRRRGQRAGPPRKARGFERPARTEDFRLGVYARAGGVVDPLPEDAPDFVRDYHADDKTPRGYHARSLNSNDGWNMTSSISFLNTPLMQYIGEISSAVLLIHGEAAHSCYFSRDAFKRLRGEHKELLLIPGAVHTDLYDRTDIIPFDRMARFFSANLK